MRAVITNGRAFASAGSNLYIKEVLRAGKYQHPTHAWPEPLDATPEYLAAVAQESNAALAAGVEIPIPDGHQHGAGDVVGWVREFFMGEGEDGSPALLTRCEITDPAYAQKIDDGSVSKVSVWLDEIGDGQYTPAHDRVVHVALTAYPVASKQGDFVRLSLDGGAQEVPVLTPYEEKSPMKFALAVEKARVLGLDIPEGHEGDEIEVSPEALVTAAEAAQAARATADETSATLATQRDEAVEALAERDKEAPEAAVARILSVDPKQDRYFARAQRSLAQAVKGEIALALEKGKIDKRGEEALTRLLSVETAYTLSAEGKAEQIDVAEAVKTLLGLIPEGAAVPVGESVAKVETEDQPDEAVKASVERMTKAANG